MAQDNTSPVTGLANRASPGSFAFDPMAVSSQAAPIGIPAAVQAGIVGSPSVSRGQAPVGQFNQQVSNTESTVRALSKMGRDIMEPLIEKEQTGQFWEGVKRVAEGTALDEILKDEPWFTQIFGNSSLVDGARAYTAQKNIQDVVTNVSRDMGDLRKRAPGEVASELTGRLQSAMTGDALTDAVIQKSAVQTLPALIKEHTKENYAFLQSELKRTQFEAWGSSASLLQSKASGYVTGTVRKEDFEFEQAKFLGEIGSLPGQTEESFKSNLINLVGKAAQDGNFHAVNALEKTGFRRFLTPEQTKSLDDTVFRYQTRAKADASAGPMAVDLGLFDAAARTGAMNPEQIASHGAVMNKRFRDLTGIDDDLIDIRQSVASSAAVLYRDQDKPLTADQKREQALGAIASGFHGGQGARAVPPRSGTERSEQDDVFRAEMAKAKNPLQYLVANAMAPEPWISPSIQGEMQISIDAGAEGKYNTGFEKSYQSWKQLRATPNGGIQTAAVYYGDKNKQLQAYDARIAQGMPPELAYQKVFVQKEKFGQQPQSKQAQKELSGAIKSQFTSYLPWVKDPEDATINMIASYASAEVEDIRRYNPGISTNEAAQQAVATLKGKGLEIQGKYGWMRMPDSAPITQLVGPNQTLLNKAVNETVEQRWKAAGASKIDTFEIVRGPDQGGVATFWLDAWDGERHYWSTMTSDDLKAHYDKGLQSWSKPTPPVPSLSEALENVGIYN